MHGAHADVHPGTPLLIATMLRDPTRMQPHFDRLMARDTVDGVRGHLSDEEVKLAFMAAPCLGLWALTVELGDRILKSDAEALVSFHHMAREPPHHFLDHEVLYHLASEQSPHGREAAVDTPAAGAPRGWKVLSSRLRMRDTHTSPDTAKSDRIRKSLDPNGEHLWRTMTHTAVSGRIERFGAVRRRGRTARG